MDLSPKGLYKGGSPKVWNNESSPLTGLKLRILSTLNNLQSGKGIPSSLTLPATLSTEDASLDNALVLFPNPSKGSFVIKNSGITLQSAQISDINGRIITTIDLQGMSEDKNIDVNLTTGMYLVKIQSENASTIKKLIIQ